VLRLDDALKVRLNRVPIPFRLNINSLALLVDKAFGATRVSGTRCSRIHRLLLHRWQRIALA
jgi:hypothetical protein